ncbi:MAG: S8 family serine peptidase [Armatimonadota bacterium]|nr:S8 family serine peptidase [Armatimonadota bacterium]
MARKGRSSSGGRRTSSKERRRATEDTAATRASASDEELLLAALERGDDSFETGRQLVTFKEGAVEEGIRALGALGALGLSVADSRDFEDQAVSLESVGDADTVVFREIGVALLGGAAAQERGLGVQTEIAADSPYESINPEYFVFAESGSGQYYGFSQAETNSSEYLRGFAQAAEGGDTGEYLRGFLHAVQAIATDLHGGAPAQLEAQEEVQEEALVLSATWGLNACKVPPSGRSGVEIRVAVLGTGLDLGHPDFAGRPVVSNTFVGQPVQDLNGHGTHMIGTACGPKSPAGSIPRYGIGFRSSIFVGKVLTDSGSGTQAGILNGMNWAVANRCEVIYAPVASPSPVQPAYTAAGQAALNRGLLMIAGSSSAGSTVGAPANSPTIMSVASLDPNLSPSLFSPSGKIEIAAPGRDVFSSWMRPVRYKTISGLATAGAHVAGCAALWAQTSPNLRGMNLWRKLQATARSLPFLATRVGAGLVQAPP